MENLLYIFFSPTVYFSKKSNIETINYGSSSKFHATRLKSSFKTHGY